MCWVLSDKRRDKKSEMMMMMPASRDSSARAGWGGQDETENECMGRSMIDALFYCSRGYYGMMSIYFLLFVACALCKSLVYQRLVHILFHAHSVLVV